MHAVVTAYCRAKTCQRQDNIFCTIFGVIIDFVFGCAAGGITAEKGPFKEALGVFFADVLGIPIDLLCDKAFEG